MIDLSQTHYYAPILVMLLVFIISYFTLKATKIEGGNWVLVTLSLLLALLVVSSTKITNYAIDLVPVIAIIAVIGFLVLLSVILVGDKELGNVKKYIMWIGFAIAIIVIVFMAFSHFTALNHMLPHSSDAGLDSNMSELKDFIYSKNFGDALVFILSIVIVGWFLVKAKK